MNGKVDDLVNLDDDRQPVGNGGEPELDDEMLEDVEWLEGAGFTVDYGSEPGDRVWLRKVSNDVQIAIYPDGSTALLWRHWGHDRRRFHQLHLGIGDDATRGEIKQLCESLGTPIK